MLRPRPQTGINARISDLVAALEISQTELGKRVGVTGSTVSKWLSDNREPSVTNAPAIAEALGVSVEFLLTGEERGEAMAYAAAARAEKERKEWQTEALRLRGELERLHAQLGLILPGRSASEADKPRPRSRRGPTKR